MLPLCFQSPEIRASKTFYILKIIYRIFRIINGQIIGMILWEVWKLYYRMYLKKYMVRRRV